MGIYDINKYDEFLNKGDELIYIPYHDADSSSSRCLLLSVIDTNIGQDNIRIVRESFCGDACVNYLLFYKMSADKSGIYKVIKKYIQCGKGD